MKYAQTKKLVARTKQAGLSLVEALAFLAIFGIVAAGAVALFTGASNSASTNNISTDVTALKTNVKALSMSGTPYSTVTTTTLNTNGRLSKQMTNQTTGNCATGVASPCANYGDGTAFKVAGTANDFTVSVGTSSAEVCNSLIAAMSGSNFTNTPTCDTNNVVAFTFR